MKNKQKRDRIADAVSEAVKDFAIEMGEKPVSRNGVSAPLPPVIDLNEYLRSHGVYQLSSKECLKS